MNIKICANDLNTCIVQQLIWVVFQQQQQQQRQQQQQYSNSNCNLILYIYIYQVPTFTYSNKQILLQICCLLHTCYIVYYS